MSGWIKLHRQIIDHWIASDLELLGAWTYMLLLANHAPAKIKVGNQIITVERGSFYTSRRKLMTKFGWSRKKLDGTLAALQREQMLDIKGGSTGTYVSIINYDSYQTYGSTEEATWEHTRRPLGSIQGGHKGATNKKNKNNNNEKKNKNEYAPGVFLTDEERARFITEFGEEFVNRCCEKLSAWIEQDPTPKRKRNGHNGAATFRAWVLNAVSEEQARANRQGALRFVTSKAGINTQSTVDVVKSFIEGKTL